MLYFDFTALFKARNINNPFSFLKKNGFSKGVAYNIVHQPPETLKLDHLYKICKLFNCTPNDVIRYRATEKDSVSETHVLNKIKGEALTDAAKEILQALSLQELSAFANLIKEKKEVL